MNNLDFIDLLSIASFCVGLVNLEENLTQGDKQDLVEEFNNKAELLLNEIHSHLELQDTKLDNILMRLEKENDR